MRLNVLTYERHQYGQREVLAERDIIAIRASYQVGAGDAILYYEGMELGGLWYPLRKKDNRGKRLPTKRDFQRWTETLTAVRGIRGVYTVTSEPFALPASPHHQITDATAWAVSPVQD